MEWCCIMPYIYSGIGIILAIIVSKLFTTSKKDVKGKHVLITGGSSGIGLSLAHEVARQGASVTIVARNVSNLHEAKEAIRKTIANVGAEGKIQCFAADVAADVEKLSVLVKEAEANLGPIFMLVNCAGYSRAAKFEDLTPEDVKKMMEVNYLGSFFMTQAVIGTMKKTGEGIIVFTSSQAGLLGLYGYTAYSASKAALVKMAEALHMEVKPYNIAVTVSVPPDTDTPGFQEENKSKPTETKLISEAAGLFQADEVAQKLLHDALKGEFFSTIGMEGFMLTTLCAGMGPISSFMSLVAQVSLSGIFRIVSSFYLLSFSRIVKNEYKKKMSDKKSD